jgi:hypothetical protein
MKTGSWSDMDRACRMRSLVAVFVLAWPLALVPFGCPPKQPPGPRPPDLTSCTRLEVQDPYGLLNYVVSVTDMHATLFDEQEMEALRSSAKYVVEDPNVIRAFTGAVSKGVFSRRGRSATAQTPPTPPPTTTSQRIRITGYRGDERVTMIEVASGSIRTEQVEIFRYLDGLPSLSLLRLPSLQPLARRLDCAIHQRKLTEDSMLFRRSLISYPDPNRWCDVTAESLWKLRGGRGARQWDAILAGLFQCPAAREDALAKGRRSASEADHSWVSDFAMNPDCRPSAPADTVLLFETATGWNQHGGPELFTFDNHDAKGGCVLLNDGTVRFVRTKEELAQLRWKP